MRRTSEFQKPVGFIRTERFLRIASNVTRYRSPSALLEEVSRLYGVDGHTRLTESALGDLRRQVYQDLLREVGRVNATYLTRLIARHLIPRHSLSVAKLCRDVWKSYDRLMSYYLPILVAYIDDVAWRSHGLGAKRIYVLTRDALPLLPVARARVPVLELRPQLSVHALELNRKSLGIVDEVANEADRRELPNRTNPQETDKKMSAEFVSTLWSAHFRGKPAMLADIGYYGTLIRELRKDRRFLRTPAWMFLASANPLVFGFLNNVFYGWNQYDKPMPFRFIWILGDTLEALPKPYHSTRLWRSPAGVVQVSKPSNWLFGIVSYLIYWSLARKALRVPARAPDLRAAITRLYGVSRARSVSEPLAILPREIPGMRKAREKLVRFARATNMRAVPPQPDLLD